MADGLVGLGALAEGLMRGYGTGLQFDAEERRNRLLELQAQAAKLASTKDVLSMVESSPDSYELYKGYVPPDQQQVVQQAATQAKARQALQTRMLLEALQGRTPTVTPQEQGSLGRLDQKFVTGLPDLVKAGRSQRYAPVMAGLASKFQQQLAAAGPDADQHELLMRLVNEAAAGDPTVIEALKEYDLFNKFNIKPLSPDDRFKREARAGVKSVLSRYQAGELDDASAARQLQPYLKAAQMDQESLAVLFPNYTNALARLRKYSETMGTKTGEVMADYEPATAPGLPGRRPDELAPIGNVQMGGYSLSPEPSTRTVGDLRVRSTEREAQAKETPGLRGLRGAQTRQANALADYYGTLKEDKSDPTLTKEKAKWRSALNVLLTDGSVPAPDNPKRILSIDNPQDLALAKANAGMTAQEQSLVNNATKLMIIPSRPKEGYTRQDMAAEYQRLLNEWRGKELFLGVNNGQPRTGTPSEQELQKLIARAMQRRGWKPK